MFLLGRRVLGDLRRTTDSYYSMYLRKLPSMALRLPIRKEMCWGDRGYPVPTECASAKSGRYPTHLECEFL